MLFIEVTVIFLYVSSCKSQDPGKKELWNDSVDETGQGDFITQKKDANIQSFHNCGEKCKSNTGEVIHSPKNATYATYDLKYKQVGQLHPAKNNAPEINGLESKEKANTVLNRDFDSFYDNELMDKVLNLKEHMPKNVQIKMTNNNPILVYKGSSSEDSETKMREKREATSPTEYEYEDEDKSGEETSAANGLSNIKQKISKMIKPKEKNNVSTTSKAEVNEQSQVKDSVNNNVKTDSPISTESNYDGYSSVKETVTVSNTNNQASDEIATLTAENDAVEALEDDNIKSVPRRKDTCRFGKNEGANCLPQGGIPKNPSVQFLGTSRDSEYDKLIKGDITEKLLKTILQKAKGNSDMASKLGICEYDIKEIKDLYNTVRNKQNECCMKLKGEFKCFLNWLLTIDPSRKKRSTNIDQMNIGKVNRGVYGEKTLYPIYLGGAHKPSPQYQKLFEKVQQYKEENSDPWSFSPDGFELPDSSINI